MGIQLAVSTRNARLDAIEVEIGTVPVLKLRSGAPPATCAAADAGTVLCIISLPSDWLAAASAGQKVKAGTWAGTASGGGGTIGHFRLYDSGGAVCRVQGTAQTAAGDMPIDNAVVSDGQLVTVLTFALTDGNA